MVKRIIKLVNFLDDTITRVAIYTGLSLLVVLAAAGFAYITAKIEPPSLELSSFINGTKAYLWIALPLLWGAAKCLKWGLAIRNWWVHTDDHKFTIGIRGLLEWRYGHTRR